MSAGVLAQLDAIFGLDDLQVLAYDDARRGIGRRILMDEGRIEAVRLVGKPAAESALKALFERAEAILNVRALLLPLAAGSSAAPASRTVCSCWNVSEHEIAAFLAKVRPGSNMLPSLQEALKCGTQCGSCIPELKGMVASAKAAA
jgi:assimilatory nitrate reductase catalytic subunit